MVRFIHAADIHLDSPLQGLATYEGAPAAKLRTATRDAFSQLVDRAIDEAVDFVVIAGDLYDGDWRDYNTGLFFCREMGRLHEAGISVYIVYGNHDAESEITRRLPLPTNVRTFSARRAETFRIDDLGVALHGRSFKQRDTTENLVREYPPPVAGWFNIGVLHTALEGHAAHASYAPCSLEELCRRGYDYWALGHVHERRVLSEAPWVVYPGNLQGRHIRECGPRGAYLVTQSGGGLTVEPLILDVVRWHHLELDVSDRATVDLVVDAVAAATSRLLAAEGRARSLAVRITLRGASPVHGELFCLEHQLRAQVLAHAIGLAAETLWIERVVFDTSPWKASGAEAGRGDALDDLKVFLDQAPDDAELRDQILSTLRDLIGKAPYALLQTMPELDDIRRGDVEGVIRRVAPALLARLAAED